MTSRCGPKKLLLGPRNPYDPIFSPPFPKGHVRPRSACLILCAMVVGSVVNEDRK